MVEYFCMIEKDENFLKLIKELKAFGASGMKLELESEYLPEEKCLEISKVLNKTGLKLILKLGGISSLNDVCTAKNAGANAIVAPMAESAYGLEKFAKTLLCVFSESELLSKKIYINIETKTGIENFDDIISSKYAKYIEGVVIGRSDLSSSLAFGENTIDSDIMYDTVFPLLEKCHREGKKVIMGGKISSLSIPFLKKIPPEYIFGFETRKIFFTSDILQKEDAKAAINKAIEFEIYYLQNFSKSFLGASSMEAKEIDDRIIALKNRLRA